MSTRVNRDRVNAYNYLVDAVYKHAGMKTFIVVTGHGNKPHTSPMQDIQLFTYSCLSAVYTQANFTPQIQDIYVAHSTSTALNCDLSPKNIPVSTAFTHCKS